LKGGTGFTSWRALVGAIPIAGVAVMSALIVASVAIILTAPAIWWALADPLLFGSAGTALVDVREVMQTAAGSDAAMMISLIDTCCPTGLVVAVAFNYIVLKIGGQAICAGFIAVMKVIGS